MASVDRNNCIFCRIYDEKQETTNLFKNESYMVFPDIKPAAKHHYLVITNEHIRNVKELTADQKDIVEELVRIGKQVLEERGGDVNDVRFGFHWPPFTSINHLHLHVISPASQVSFIPGLIFRENSFWFVTPEYVISRLEAQ